VVHAEKSAPPTASGVGVDTHKWLLQRNLGLLQGNLRKQSTSPI
jgi:hypothetical protein